MTRILRFEWVRLRSRRDLYVIIAVFSLLVIARESSTIREIASLLTAPGIPEEAAKSQRQMLAAYSSGSSIATVVNESALLMLLLTGFLTCWTFGGEFGNGTVRTALLSDPRRGRYLLGRLIGAAALGLICVAVVAAIGAGMPTIAAALGVDVGRSEPTLQTVVFLGATLVVVLFAVALGLLVTALVRSPLLSVGSFLAAAAFGQLLEASVPDDLRSLVPTRAVFELLASTAPVGAILPGGGELAGDVAASPVRPALVVAVWSILLLAGAVASFESKDVRE